MIVGITGGTGFIGERLVCRHLQVGDTVRVLSRRVKKDIPFGGAVRLFLGDLTENDQVVKDFVDGVDILYHCAGEIRDQAKMYPVHVSGTKNLCTAAAGRIGHWVQLSSVGVYGPCSNGIVTEEASLNPLGLYEKTKARSDEIVMNAGARGAFTYAILRPSNVFGFSMTNRSLYQMITMINRGFFFFIGIPGASANYIHVDNVVEGLVRCGRARGNHFSIFNLSDHRTIEDFIAVIARELGRPAPMTRLPEKMVRWLAKIGACLPHFPLTESRINALTCRSVYSTERIERELGYAHPVSMEDGLRDLVQGWWRPV